MPSLRRLVSEGRPQEYPIFKAITSIGSARGNDIEIRESGLAPHHLELVFDGRDFVLSIIEGADAFRVNGKKKKKSKIFHGDEIELEGSRLLFSLLDEGHATTPQGNDPEVHQVQGMKRLAEFSGQINTGKTVQEQLQILTDAVIEATDAEKGFVILVEDGTPKVTVARARQHKDLDENVAQISDSIVQQVMHSKRAMIVSDALNDSLFRSSESIMNLQLSSVMCAPMMAQGQLIGIVYVGSTEVRSLFDDNALAMFSVLAAQGALLLQNALLRDELRSDRDQLEEALKERSFGTVIGSSEKMAVVFDQVQKVATTDVSVLITGETGTGKELIAHEIHKRSARASKPFVVINCGAIPENLMESELFGHVRGAFTGAATTKEGRFQAADGGTLFLDEIGEMPINLQVKLLRALQERVVMKVGGQKTEHVDIRVLAATNRDLEKEISEGRFREDLYYRLNVINIQLPPLRERDEDITVIAKFFLRKYAGEFKSEVKGFTPGALEAMQNYHWSGNVRQLENRIKKALVLCTRTLIGPEDLDLKVEEAPAILPLSEAKEAFQRKYVLDALKRNDGNRTQTARDLGVDPRTIFRYLERETEAD